MKDDWTDGRIGEQLRDAFSPPEFPEREIRSRIRQTLKSVGSESDTLRDRTRRHPVVRTVLAAAATLMVFLAGSEYGRRTAEPTAPEAGGVQEGTPVAIQTSGSRYVANLARFAEHAPALGTAEREEAREAAVAVLYAAVTELLAQEDDELLAITARLMYSLRQSQYGTDTEGVLLF